MKLLHYSSKPIKRVRTVVQVESLGGGRMDKPKGLWVSVEGEDDWRSWCESESYSDPSRQICYQVELSDSANVLHLRSEPAILAFTNEHGCDPYMGAMAGTTEMFGHGIRWDKVAEEYDGIIIAPYCWALRLDERTNWYYSWDCASGCIWNAGAVALLSVVAQPEKQAVNA